MSTPVQLIARMLRLAAAAKRSKKSIAIEDALDGEELAEWERLKREMERVVAAQPS